MQDQQDFQNTSPGFQNYGATELQEKQRILKDRLLLIGQNLVEFKEQTQKENLEIKKEIEILKQNMERLIKFLEIASTELTKFAKKEDLDLLSKKINLIK